MPGELSGEEVAGTRNAMTRAERGMDGILTMSSMDDELVTSGEVIVMTLAMPLERS